VGHPVLLLPFFGRYYSVVTVGSTSIVCYVMMGSHPGPKQGRHLVCCQESIMLTDELA